MAITKSYGYGTDAASTTTVTASSVLPVTGFALVEDEPTSCSLINDSSALDVGEKLSYQCQTIGNVTSGLDNVYPPAVKTGVQYQVKLDEQIALTDSGNPSYKEVLPVVAYINIRHPKNGNISSSDIDTIFKRLVGACLKSDGTTRFSDLMKSALRPTTDGPAAAS
jgi:hypothetical protein